MTPLEIEYVGPKWYADKWKVTAETVRTWCGQGLISGAIMAGKQWRIPVHALPPDFRQVKATQSDNNPQ